MSGALVLNATYEPLCVVTQRRALNLILQAKAELVSATEHRFRSATASFPAPSVVRLIVYVKVPYTTRVALNRRAVFARDNYRCQYCYSPAENIDHVIPRSRGGTHTWENVVAACRPCNARKEDRMLDEINMRLRRPPTTPHARAWVIAATGSRRPDWEQWLGAPMHASAAMASA
ncbi:MAG TPA: HNH endonuclease [Acidimicrobiales bacterium]|nr:HNH endonuclease [Acidimicrobiales bacterium]